MKKSLTALALLFSFSFCIAQTGLQFSQVRLLEVPIPATNGPVVSVGTVPAGKVWKLENVQCNNYTLDIYQFQINGTGINYSLPTPYTSGSAVRYMNNGPIWYPAGTVIAVRRNTGNSSADYLLFSILEFTVVP